MQSLITGLLLGTLLIASGPCTAADDTSSSSQDGATSAFQKQLNELQWIRGPQHVQLFDNSAFDVPAGYVFLNPAETEKLQTITHNIGGQKEYFFGPRDLHWGAYFHFSADGYVKDGEQINADSLLESIKKNTEEGNKQRREHGWDEMTVTGWQTPPSYDTQTKHLEWAILAKDDKTNNDIVNFNTRILGRGGVTSVVLVAAPATLGTSISEFKSSLAAFDYLPGQRYAEYKPGDKIAEYGLAALITGGAAAIAVKTGFWKVIVGALVAGWKFILAGAVAVSAGLKKWFKRKTT